MGRIRGIAWFRGAVGALCIAVGGCAMGQRSPAAAGAPAATFPRQPPARQIIPAPQGNPPVVSDPAAPDLTGRLAARQQFASMSQPTGATVVYRDEAVTRVTPVAAEEVPAPAGASSPSAEGPWNTQAIPSPMGEQQPRSRSSLKLVPLPGDEKRITLHIDDLDVRKALEMLSRQTCMSLAISPGVSGRVTVDLRDKTIGEALDTISRLCHLTIRRDRNITYVSTLADERQSEEDKLPIRVYHLNYVRSTDVEAMIRPLLSPEKGTMTTSPDAERGIGASPDKAGGNLLAGGDIVIVQDYEEILRTIDRVVAQIDVQPQQVLIEAVVLQLQLTKDMELGVNFALLDGAGKGLGGRRQRLGDQRRGRLSAGLGVGGGRQGGQQRRRRFLRKRPRPEVRLCQQEHHRLHPRLETLGETKVLACPRVLVVNKQRAEIQLGDRLGYATTTQNSTSTTQQVKLHRHRHAPAAAARSFPPTASSAWKFTRSEAREPSTPTACRRPPAPS